MKVGFVGALLTLAQAATGQSLIQFTNGTVESHATEIGGTYQVPQIPTTSALHAASQQDGTETTTGYTLTDSLFTFEPDDLLSGAVGSRATSGEDINFVANADLHFEIAGDIHTGTHIWQNNPPNCALDIRLLNPSSGLFWRTFNANAPVKFDPADFTTGSTIYGTTASGTLRQNAAYEFFANSNLTDTGAGGAGELSGSVQLRLSLIGDFNGDRSVGFPDVLIVAQHYGLSGRDATYATGDANQDGNVGFDDLLVLAQHYGENFSSPAASS